jgi:cobalt-zinc-cadmium efflux system membrane fusion protein
MMDQPVHGHEPPPVVPATPLPRKAQIAVLLVVTGIAVAAFVAGPAAFHALFGGKTKEAAAGGPAADSDGSTFKATDRQWASLKVRKIEDQVFQDATVTDGKIAIDDELVTPVFSPYSGRVTKLIARPGDEVARGDPLFAVEASELAQGENDLISAVAALKTAKAQLSLAETNEKRQHSLYQAQGAALKDWQQSQVDLATAQGGMNSAAIALASVRNRLRILGKTDADIAAIEAAPDFLHVEADTPVRAPIAGTVTQRTVGLGQNIISAASGASNPVFLIGDLSKVWLVGNAREEDAPLLQKGDPVEVGVLAYPNRVFKAKLTYIAAAIDPNTHRLAVRAEVENPKGELKPEMLANFRIITGEDVANPAVPERAIVYEGTTAHLWVADPKEKKLGIRQVKLGRIKSGMVEVVDGLKAGEAVVVSGGVFIDRAAAGD